MFVSTVELVSTVEPVSTAEPVSKTTMKTMKVRFERKNSSLDPNDPAVMDAMLKQVNLYKKNRTTRSFI